MQRLKSSNLHSHAYDPLEQKYSVLFNCGKCKGNGCADCKHQGHTGQLHVYEDVPAEKYAAVRDAPEKVGSVFHREIVKHRHPETGLGFKFTKRPV